MKRLRLGIIGTGIAARDLYWPQLRLLKSRIEIVAVANRRRAKAEAFARLAGVKTVCADGDALLARADVDAVLLSLPIHLNAAWVLKALRAGKHVLCEKPIASNAAEGRRLVHAASKSNKLWLVGENYFFTPHMAKAREWVLSGKLGKAHLIEVAQVNLTLPSNKYFQTSWRQDPKFVGGFVVDAGVHLANIVRESFGMPLKVRSFTAAFNPLLKPIDTAAAILQFKGGTLGVWRSCFSALSASPMPLVKAYGSKGTLEIHGRHSTFSPLRGRALTVHSIHDGFYHQFLHFADAVAGGKKLQFKPMQALKDLEFMQRVIGK
jgi:predicted dehydrogenase